MHVDEKKRHLENKSNFEVNSSVTEAHRFVCLNLVLKGLGGGAVVECDTL